MTSCQQLIHKIPEQERFESSIGMLTFVESLGQRGPRSRSRGCGGQEDSFEAAHLGLVARRHSGDQCFSYDTAAVRGEVCLPGALLEAEPCPGRALPRPRGLAAAGG